MIKTLRTAVAVLTVGLLTLGYALSQLNFFQGKAQEYAQQVDTPPIAYGATVLLFIIVLLAFVREKESDPK